MDKLLVRSIETTTHGRFLLRAPAGTPPWPLLVGFHGYGETAEKQMENMRRIPGSDACVLASVQGLHRFYTSRFDEIGASWMTRQDRELAIVDNIAYVDRVMQAVSSEYRTQHLVFLGFSQGVAMAFRAAARCAVQADGVIALGGDVPPDVSDVPAPRFGRVLLARGTNDTWYTEQRLQADVEDLEARGVPVDRLVFGGSHEWSDDFRAAAGQFLQSLHP